MEEHQVDTISDKRRYDWVDYAKGICIFAVVSLYSAKVALQLLGDDGWMKYWAEFARPFRMPDFFLLSGLFLGRVIDRPWPGYIDKKILHYSYFFLLWSLINLVILYAIGERHGDIFTFLKQLWSMISSWPYQMLWFIQMLPAYFLFTRLTRNIPKWIVLSIACLLHAYPIVHTDRVILDDFWKFYVYFFTGYAFAPIFFQFATFVQKNVKLTLVGLVVWIIINATFVHTGLASKPFIAIALGLVGVMAIISFGALAEKTHFARWIRYLGKNSIVVYLAFYWPMKLAAYLLLPFVLLTSNPGLFASIITLLGLLGSLSLFWLLNWRTKDRLLFRRPVWATITS